MDVQEILARSKILEDFGCPLATFQERDINRPILLKRGFFRDQYLNLPYKDFQIRFGNADGAILTKADVDEKGGAPLSIAYTIKKPILFLGVGWREYFWSPHNEKGRSPIRILIYSYEI